MPRGERALHARWLEERAHQDEQQHRGAHGHPEEPLVEVGGEPVAIDREAIERLVRQTETEEHLELVAWNADNAMPDCCPAGEF